MRTLTIIKEEIEEKINNLKIVFPNFTFSIKLFENEIIYVYTLKKLFSMCHIIYDYDENLLFVSYKSI